MSAKLDLQLLSYHVQVSIVHTQLFASNCTVHFFFFFLRGISITGVDELLESEIPGFLVKPNTRVFNSKRGIKRWKSREQGSTLLEVCFKYMKIFLWSQESEGRLIIHQKIFMHVRFGYWYEHIPAESARRLKIHHKTFMLD